MSSKGLSHRGVIHVGFGRVQGLDRGGVLRPEDRVADVEKITHDEESVRRLVTRLGSPAKLWACYEAGPTGFELHRLLERLGVRCDVIATSLIPRAPGDKVGRTCRDAKRLARLHRAGELTAIRVVSWPSTPSVADPDSTALTMMARRSRMLLATFTKGANLEREARAVQAASGHVIATSGAQSA